MGRSLYADENFPVATVEGLRQFGHDVLTVAESGKANQGTPDQEILQVATSLGRAVLTENRRHFIRLHAQRPAHAGIIVCSADRDFLAQANRIHQALEAEGELAGLLIRVSLPSAPP